MTIVGGTVTATTDAAITVTLDRPVGCASCGTDGGCGLGPVIRLFVKNSRQSLELKNIYRDRYAVGDRVGIVVPPGRLAATALIAYGLPLLALCAGATAGVALSSSGGDAAAVAGAAAGAAISAAFVRLGGIGRAVAGSLRVVSWKR